MSRGRPKGSKNKLVPLSKESEEKVKKGLQEAKEGKFISEKEMISEKLLEERKEEKNKEEINPNLKRTVNDLAKQFGHEVIHFASEEPEKERIPSEIEALDRLIMGFPEGAFSILWGGTGSTKTTAALKTIAKAQSLGKTCFFIDKEHSFDKEWAKKNGVDLDKLLLGTNYKTAEEAMDVAIRLCNDKVVDVIVLDSVQALSPKGEQVDKKKIRSIADDEMGLLARKLSKFFRIGGHKVYKGKVTFILIAQTRVDLGQFIKLETLSGGHALSHWATLIIKAYRAGKADAPHYKFPIKSKNNEGKEETKEKSFPIGFQICYRLEKKKISYCAPEKTETRQNFYHEFGFRKPTNEEIKNLYAEWIDFEESTE